MIEYSEAVLLGIIQGLTEFIPVSSTAHLKIIPSFFNMSDPGAAYSAVIQLGTLVSLLIYFRDDLISFSTSAIRGIMAGRPFEEASSRMVWYLVLGTIPVSVFGLLLSGYITGPFRSLYVISTSLIVLATLLLIADRRALHTKEVENLTMKDIFIIGMAQSLALIPGASRSGTTLTAGLFIGYSRYAAMRISFLLSIPAIALSGVYELIKEREELAHAGFGGLFVATLVSGVVGYITIAGLLRFLKNHTTLVFVLYRISMGITILVLLHLGILQP